MAERPSRVKKSGGCRDPLPQTAAGKDAWTECPPAWAIPEPGPPLLLTRKPPKLLTSCVAPGRPLTVRVPFVPRYLKYQKETPRPSPVVGSEFRQGRSLEFACLRPTTGPSPGLTKSSLPVAPVCYLFDQISEHRQARFEKAGKGPPFVSPSFEPFNRPTVALGGQPPCLPQNVQLRRHLRRRRLLQDQQGLSLPSAGPVRIDAPRRGRRAGLCRLQGRQSGDGHCRDGARRGWLRCGGWSLLGGPLDDVVLWMLWR